MHKYDYRNLVLRRFKGLLGLGGPFELGTREKCRHHYPLKHFFIFQQFYPKICCDNENVKFQLATRKISLH